MKIKNIAPGPRGFNSVNGPALLDPGEETDAKVFEREKHHIDATGWFETSGNYEPNPSDFTVPALYAAASDADDEIEALKRQLAERDAELAKLKSSELDRDDLKKQADELGLKYPGNISNVKLKELIDAKLAS